MITHTVAFHLKEPEKLELFLGRARQLASIPGVIDFKILKQVGQKNAFSHALSMRFVNQSDYDAYNVHPDHQAFVSDVWIPGVADFIELDYLSVPEPHN